MVTTRGTEVVVQVAAAHPPSVRGDGRVGVGPAMQHLVGGIHRQEPPVNAVAQRRSVAAVANGNATTVVPAAESSFLDVGEK